MCIALLSTAHPKYQLILIDNRDEFVSRPTADAAWWPEPHSHVFGGRDLLRDVQGTWLGVTTSGKIAVLTNFKEDQPPPLSALSRGEIIKKFLTDDVGTTEEFVTNVVNTGVARDAGGFSLVCGNIGERLAVISNRTATDAQVPWVCGDVVQTVGLSNTAYQDRTWRKVTEGEQLMLLTLRQNIQEDGDEDDLVQKLLALLGDDEMKRLGCSGEGGLEACISEMRNSIFIPPVGRKSMAGKSPDEIAAAKKNEIVEVLDEQAVRQELPAGMSGIYATQKQSVVLVNHQNEVRFVERTLWDADSNPVPPGESDIDVKFTINPTLHQNGSHHG